MRGSASGSSTSFHVLLVQGLQGRQQQQLTSFRMDDERCCCYLPANLSMEAQSA